MNYSAVALVIAEFALLANAVTWAATGHPWIGAAWVAGMWATWWLKGWVIA